MIIKHSIKPHRNNKIYGKIREVWNAGGRGVVGLPMQQDRQGGPCGEGHIGEETWRWAASHVHIQGKNVPGRGNSLEAGQSLTHSNKAWAVRSEMQERPGTGGRLSRSCKDCDPYSEVNEEPLQSSELRGDVF